MESRSYRFLSGNALKLIAAAAMLIDHMGLMFFPNQLWMRVLGRLAMPIYGFMIAEGCKYTRSRLRYFLTVAVLAAVCQIVYYVFDGSLYFSILVTFSLSILVTYCWQFLRESWAAAESPLGQRILSGLLFPAAVAGVWWLNQVLTIDYGFWGCMLPVIAGLFRQRRGAPADGLSGLDRPEIHVGMLALGAALLAWDLGGVQIYGLLTVPLLLCYSGQRGKWGLKYFFYIFYPVHLALLQLVQILMG